MAADDGNVKSANGMGIKIMLERVKQRLDETDIILKPGIKIMLERVKPATESRDLINGMGIKIMEEQSVWYIW